jgi:hypothetical protein
VERITEVGQLAVLVVDISKVLVDHGMPPILGTPQNPGTASNVLEVAGTILECVWEAHASGHGPND